MVGDVVWEHIRAATMLAWGGYIVHKHTLRWIKRYLLSSMFRALLGFDRAFHFDRAFLADCLIDCTCHLLCKLLPYQLHVIHLEELYIRVLGNA